MGEGAILPPWAGAGFIGSCEALTIKAPVLPGDIYFMMAR